MQPHSDDKLLQSLRASTLTRQEISDALREAGLTGSRGQDISTNSIDGWAFGYRPIPKHVRETLAEILENKPSELTNRHLEDALKATSIHTALKSLRRALKLPYHEFALALKPHLPSGIAPSAPAMLFWETELGQNRSSLPSRKVFMGTDPITAYGEVFRAKGMGEWFDAHKEHFNQLLLEAMVSERKVVNSGHATRWNSSRVKDKPPFWNDYLANRATSAANQQER